MTPYRFPAYFEDEVVRNRSALKNEYTGVRRIGWIADGKIKWEETIVDGIENAPKAFLGLFTGENMGKMLVRIGPEAS